MNDKVRKFRLSEVTRVQNGVTLRRIEYLRTLVGADGETIVSAGTKAGYADITGNARVGGHTVVTGGSLDGDFQLSGEGVIIAMPS